MIFMTKSKSRRQYLADRIEANVKRGPKLSAADGAAVAGEDTKDYGRLMGWAALAFFLAVPVIGIAIALSQ